MHEQWRGNSRWIVLTDLLTTNLDDLGLSWRAHPDMLGRRDRLDSRGRLESSS